MSKLFKIVILLGLLFCAGLSQARTTRPASGKHLKPGHWLTCWGGQDVAYRKDPAFHKATDDQKVRQYTQNMSFSGTYSFEVKDTWEELVTRSGMDCMRCGETCTTTGSGSSETRSCSCNYCTWQELETFYRPWSKQKVEWTAKLHPKKAYQDKRTKWLNDYKQMKVDVGMKRSEDLQELLIFDPERPYDAFLFPGEVEHVVASNSSGIFASHTSIQPQVNISNARYEYSINNNLKGHSSNNVSCNDRDYTLHADIQAGQRKVTLTPNTIEFRDGWMQVEQNELGEVVSEDMELKLTDVGATRFEEQNVHGNYKNTQVGIRVREINRAWMFDRTISKEVEIADNKSYLKWNKNSKNPLEPEVGEYYLKSSELLLTPLFESRLHLNPGKDFEICSRVWRKNNIYYKQYRGFSIEPFRLDAWSEFNCARFTYNGEDRRSGGRKVRDFWTNYILPIPIWW